MNPAFPRPPPAASCNRRRPARHPDAAGPCSKAGNEASLAFHERAGHSGSKGSGTSGILPRQIEAGAQLDPGNAGTSRVRDVTELLQRSRGTEQCCPETHNKPDVGTFQAVYSRAVREVLDGKP